MKIINWKVYKEVDLKELSKEELIEIIELKKFWAEDKIYPVWDWMLEDLTIWDYNPLTLKYNEQTHV